MAAAPFPLHFCPPSLQKMCRSVKWHVNVKSSQYLKWSTAGRLPCLQEPHLYPSTSSCHWEEFKGSWHKHEGPWKSHSYVVWILGHLSFARGILPCVINPPPAIYLQHLKMFCRGWRLHFYERDSEKEAVASPVSPRKEYLGALFLSVQTPSALFAPRQHFLWNQTTGSCPKFYQMITPWKPKCDCMSWASSRRFCETEGSSWWHNSNYSSFSPLLK